MKTLSLRSERIIRDNKYVSPPPPSNCVCLGQNEGIKRRDSATSISPLYEGDVKSDLVTLGKSCWTGFGSLEVTEAMTAPLRE